MIRNRFEPNASYSSSHRLDEQAENLPPLIAALVLDPRRISKRTYTRHHRAHFGIGRRRHTHGFQLSQPSRGDGATRLLFCLCMHPDQPPRHSWFAGTVQDRAYGTSLLRASDKHLHSMWKFYYARVPKLPREIGLDSRAGESMLSSWSPQPHSPTSITT